MKNGTYFSVFIIAVPEDALRLVGLFFLKRSADCIINGWWHIFVQLDLPERSSLWDILRIDFLWNMVLFLRFKFSFKFCTYMGLDRAWVVCGI